MARERTFNPGDPFPSDYPDAAGDFLSTSAHNFRVQFKPGDMGTLQVPAGAGDDQAAVAIEGRWRWNTAAVEHANLGGGARDLDVHVTAASDNSYVPGGGGETDATIRSFALAITETGGSPPGVVLSRRVAVAHWDGSQFTGVRSVIGHVFDNDPRLSGALPVGATTGWCGSADPPGGIWMLCDGRAISRVTYAGLFAVLSTEYGAGDGSTTFNLPDFRGRVAVGAGAGGGLTARALGAEGGEETHVLSTGEMPSHNHPAEIDVRGATGETSVTGGTRPLATTGVQTAANSQVNTTATGGGGAHNNMPPFLVEGRIIRVL